MDQFLDFLEGSQEGRRKLVESDMSHNMDKSFLSAITSTISLHGISAPLFLSPLLAGWNLSQVLGATPSRES